MSMYVFFVKGMDIKSDNHSDNAVEGFIKATRLSRLQEGDTGISFSRLQGYQGYRRGMQGWVSQGYKAIKATGGGHGD